MQATTDAAPRPTAELIWPTTHRKHRSTTEACAMNDDLKLESLTAISPLDGRYRSKLARLPAFASEFALMRYRVIVELRWFAHLAAEPALTELGPLPDDALAYLAQIEAQFGPEQAEQIKALERTTNHDVKAVEYFVKQQLASHAALKPHIEFVHFACTSEDINNLAHAMVLRDVRDELLLPATQRLIEAITVLATSSAGAGMLARTHGQAASPTTMGKEMANVAYRLLRQRDQLTAVPLLGKFNGAVGNYNAHLAAYPTLDWPSISARFINGLGLQQNPYTTQIEPHDYIAEFFHALMRFNQVLLDFDRDIWGYIAISYFKQRAVEGETGSSTMPHKVNPIDFENSEGNLGLANALLAHMAEKLAISRWQRDLSDSTVLRNIGSALGYALVAYEATLKGIGKLELAHDTLAADLDASWEVLAEPVQTLMRKHGIGEPYEKLKALTRGRQLDQALYRAVLDGLALPDEVRQALAEMTPAHYTGLAESLALAVGRDRAG